MEELAVDLLPPEPVPDSKTDAMIKKIMAQVRPEAERAVHNEIERLCNVTWPRDPKGNYRILKGAGAETADDFTLVKQLLVNDAPAVGSKLEPLSNLVAISTDGVALHITYGLGGLKDKTKKDKERRPTNNNTADEEEFERGVTWDGARGPTFGTGITVVTSDPGRSEVVYTRLPDQIGDALVKDAADELVGPERKAAFEADDAAPVRGNRQLSAGTYHAVARTKQRVAAQSRAVAKRRGHLALVVGAANVPTAVPDLACATSLGEMERTIQERGAASIALHYIKFHSVFCQNRRAIGLAKKRMSEQVARSIVELAQPVADRLWRAERVQVAAFSESTRARQEHRARIKPRNLAKEAKRKAIQTLVIVNGGWTGAGGGKGTSSSFPRMELQALVDRALRHIAKTKLGVNNLFSCRVDEYRTSKQDGKLRSLLSGKRKDKRNPTSGTVAVNSKGERFEIVDDRPWKLMQFTDRKGTVRVSNRDEATCTAMASVYIRASLGQKRIHTISRASVSATKTAPSSGRSGDAKRTRPRAST
jgi:hypothetical protein